MRQYTLARSGSVPLRFEGELLARSDGRVRNGQESNRWHNLRLYRTAGGHFVVQVVYVTSWQGEESRFTSFEGATPSELVAKLMHYNPTASVLGFPPGEAYAEKQKRILVALATQFGAQVTELFAEVEEEFAERLD